VKVRVLKIASWIALGLGVLGILVWAIAPRTLSDIGPLWPLVWIWLGIMGLVKASRAGSEREQSAWTIRRRRRTRANGSGGSKHA
jgi:hypothetical protein